MKKQIESFEVEELHSSRTSVLTIKPEPELRIEVDPPSHFGRISEAQLILLLLGIGAVVTYALTKIVNLVPSRYVLVRLKDRTVHTKGVLWGTSSGFIKVPVGLHSIAVTSRTLLSSSRVSEHYLHITLVVEYKAPVSTGGVLKVVNVLGDGDIEPLLEEYLLKCIDSSLTARLLKELDYGKSYSSLAETELKEAVCSSASRLQEFFLRPVRSTVSLERVDLQKTVVAETSEATCATLR